MSANYCQKPDFSENQTKRKCKIDHGSRKKSKAKVFQFGNYRGYYGYRNNTVPDPRLEFFKADMFYQKDVLDIGCNAGQMTLSLAEKFSPKTILGIDIDSELIKMAKKNQNHIGEKVKFVEFEVLNYLSEPFEHFPYHELSQYDVILCLSLTKWIHLNWGDEGLKRSFEKMFQQLRPGGFLILEPQPWFSYKKKAKMTSQTLQNYRSIKFKPENFKSFLLNQVGFENYQLLGVPENTQKGFQRAIYLYEKKK